MRALEFHWEQKDDRWVLEPSRNEQSWRITVRTDANGYWRIHLNDDVVLNARYTSLQGAKLDAWEYLKCRKSFFVGNRRIRLAGATAPPSTLRRIFDSLRAWRKSRSHR